MSSVRSFVFGLSTRSIVEGPPRANHVTWFGTQEPSTINSKPNGECRNWIQACCLIHMIVDSPATSKLITSSPVQACENTSAFRLHAIFLLRKDARQRRRSHSTQQCRHCEATGCCWHRPCCCLPRLHAAWLAVGAWPFPTLSWTLRLHKDWEEPLNKNLDFAANASWRHVAAQCMHAFFWESARYHGHLQRLLLLLRPGGKRLRASLRGLHTRPCPH